jgi:hypothetical protein
MILIVLVIVIFLTIFFVSELTNKQENTENIVLKPIFIKATNYRKKDDVLQKAECSIEFNNQEIFIKQNDKKIVNNISSIYEVRIWEYKDNTYFAIKMKSHTEYMFLSQHFEHDKLLKFAKKFKFGLDDCREF